MIPLIAAAGIGRKLLGNLMKQQGGQMMQPAQQAMQGPPQLGMPMQGPPGMQPGGAPTEFPTVDLMSQFPMKRRGLMQALRSIDPQQMAQAGMMMSQGQWGSPMGLLAGSLLKKTPGGF